MTDTVLDPLVVTANKLPGETRQANRTDWTSDYNELNFVITQRLAKLQTSIPVKVIAVTPVTGYAGFVDVQPMVEQITSTNELVPSPELFNLPYCRIQGGSNGIIIDPAVGDIGLACFCSRDISSVKNSKKYSPPGSRRMYDYADGVYIGGILNGTPTQFIQFTNTGIVVTSPNAVTINAPTTTINGNLTVSGVTTTGGTINLNTHVHSDPQGSNTGGPKN